MLTFNLIKTVVVPSKQLTPQQMADYERDGYIIVKNFCTSEEIERLYSTALEDVIMHKKTPLLNDQL